MRRYVGAVMTDEECAIVYLTEAMRLIEGMKPCYAKRALHRTVRLARECLDGTIPDSRETTQQTEVAKWA